MMQTTGAIDPAVDPAAVRAASAVSDAADLSGSLAKVDESKLEGRGVVWTGRNHLKEAQDQTGSTFHAFLARPDARPHAT